MSVFTPKTKRISINSREQQKSGNAFLWKRSISKDGRFAAFETNQKLVRTDAASTSDIYVRDTKTGKTTIVSVRSQSKDGGADAYSPEVSANGRLVVFEAFSEDLVAFDNNSQVDVFVHDRKTGKTKRVNVRSNGDEAVDGGDQPSISPNGRYVAFNSVSNNLVSGDINGLTDIFVHDRETGKTTRASVRSNGTESNGSSEHPSVSDKGTVAFSSGADNLVGSDTNSLYDVFVHNLKTGKTERVSVASTGMEGDRASGSAAISREGNVVAFRSSSTTFILGAGDTQNDIFVHIRSSGETRLISKQPNGAPSNGTSYSYQGALSYNGRYVAFASLATDLVANDTNGLPDMFWHDRKTGTTKRVSKTFDESNLDMGVVEGSISGDGRFVAFDTGATNVLDQELSGNTVFIRGSLH